VVVERLDRLDAVRPKAATPENTANLQVMEDGNSKEVHPTVEVNFRG
jgi:hypothetical protein